jgi:hypothetical protein
MSAAKERSTKREERRKKMDRKIQQTMPQTASLEQAFPLKKLLSRQSTMEIKIIALRKEEGHLR